jgi:hypothetical protein
MYLLALPLTELVAIAGKAPESNNYPAIMRIAANQLLGPNALNVLREMLDRSHGRSQQVVNISTQTDKNMRLEELTVDELLLMRSLMAKAQIEDATILLE